MHFERGFWEPSEKHLLYRLAQSIAEGEGKEIVTFLGAHLEETLGNTHRSDDLRAALREHGFPPLDLADNRRVPNGIERLQARFRSALEPYSIRSEVLSRPEPEQLVERMRADGGARLLFVTGDAGGGKSGVLLDAVRLLDEQKVPYLPIRLDTHYPDRAVRAYSKDRLELPASPAVCLRTLADGRRAVLIIDQLDAVRWTSANSDVGWELCKEIIDEALRFPNVSVVVAGRTVDLDVDPRIKHWKKGKEIGQAIGVEAPPRWAHARGCRRIRRRAIRRRLRIAPTQRERTPLECPEPPTVVASCGGRQGWNLLKSSGAARFVLEPLSRQGSSRVPRRDARRAE